MQRIACKWRNYTHEGLAVASIARDVGSSSTNRSSDRPYTAFSTEITKKKLFDTNETIINKTVTCFRSRLSVSKISDIATITNFSIPLPSSTRNPGIIPSDGPGEALSVSSKDVYLSKHAKISGIHCTMWPQCTNVTDRRTDRRTSRAKKEQTGIPAIINVSSLNVNAYSGRLTCIPW